MAESSVGPISAEISIDDELYEDPTRMCSTKRSDAKAIQDSIDIWSGQVRNISDTSKAQGGSLADKVSQPTIEELQEALERTRETLTPEKTLELDSKLERTLDPSLLDQLEEALELTEPLPPQLSVTARLDRVIALLLDQLQKISEKDKDKTLKLEETYKESTAKAARIQKQLGSSQLKTSIFTLCASFLQAADLHPKDREIARLFADKVVSGIGGVFSSGLNAEFTKAQNECTDANTRIQNATTASQDASNAKQTLTDILNKLAQAVQAAARFA